MRTWYDRAWGWGLRNALLPAGDRLFGQRMMARLRMLEQAQWWAPEQIAKEKNQILNTTVRTAYDEVPFYRDLMNRAGVTPDNVHSPGDLRKLPIVTKDQLRADYPRRTVRATGFRTYTVSSSGSTGANFYVREDTDTAGWYRATFLLACEWTGWSIGERHMQTGMTLRRSTDRAIKDALLRCRYVSAFDLSDDHLDRALDSLDRHRVDYLWGYPGSLYYLARRAAARGWNRPLRSIATWGDNLYAHYRQTIEGAFQTRVFDQYGCGEGMQIAAQCGCGNNYHIHELDVVLELVDDAGEPVSRGQVGNVILTRLHAGPMPLIRYRVGDLAVTSDRSCGCGRCFSVLDSIQGRDTDVIITPSGNRLIVHFFTGILENFSSIRSFQVVQTELEAITLRIVPHEMISGATVERIVNTLKLHGAQDLHIEVELTSEIPVAPSGKRRFVIGNFAGSRSL